MRRWTWLGFIVLVLALSYFLRIGFFTYALYAVLALVLTSRWMGARSLDGLSHRRWCPSARARLGESVDVRLEVRHGGRLPLPWVLVEDLVPQALPRQGEAVRAATLWPGQSLGLRYRLECTRRGYHQIGPLLLESGDLFGLVRRFSTDEQAHYLTVHPEIVPLGGYDIASPKPVGEVRSQRRIFEDPVRLRGVRDWQPGDKLTRIHWRSTARLGRLQTKIYEPSTMVGALLVLDMYEPAYGEVGVEERSELGVVAAASLAAYVAAARQSVGFLSNGRDAADRARYGEIEVQAATRRQAERMARMREESDRLRPFEVPVGRGEVTLQRLLDATARVELSDFQPVGRMLLREYPRLAREASVVVITPRADRELGQAAAAMKQSGFIVSVVIVDANPEPEGRGRLVAEGVPVYVLRGKSGLGQLGAMRL